MRHHLESHEPLRVYLPVYNVASWAERFELPQGVKLIAADNASSDGTADILEKRGIEVIRHKENIGRVENWEFCLQHFVKSDATWIKLHMSGDSIAPDALAIWQNTLKNVPNAKFIATDWDISENGQTRPGRRVDKYLTISPIESVRRFAESGNWIGPPLNVFIHRELIETGFNLGKLPFVADMQLFLHCAEMTPTVLAPGVIGCFNLSERRFHKAHCNDFESRCQDAIIRYNAARKYKHLSGDESGFRLLISKIDAELTKTAIMRQFPANQEIYERVTMLEPVSTNILIKTLGKRIKIKAGRLMRSIIH